MEDQEEYKVSPKGIAIALMAEKLIKEGASLEEAAERVGLEPIQLRILFVLMPNITLQDVEGRI